MRAVLVATKLGKQSIEKLAQLRLGLRGLFISKHPKQQPQMNQNLKA